MTYRYLRYAYEAPETRNWLPDFWPSLWLRPRVTALYYTYFRSTFAAMPTGA